AGDLLVIGCDLGPTAIPCLRKRAVLRRRDRGYQIFLLLLENAIKAGRRRFHASCNAVKIECRIAVLAGQRLEVFDGGAVTLGPGGQRLPKIAATIALQRLAPLLRLGGKSLVSVAEIITIKVQKAPVPQLLPAIGTVR